MKGRFKHTAATKRRLSEMRRGEGNPFYGKKHSPEVKAQMAARLIAFNATRQYDIGPVTIKIPSLPLSAYLAGLIDGDGSIGYVGKSPRIFVYNCFKPVMTFLVREIGGSFSVAHRNGRSPNYCWRVYGVRNCYKLVESIRGWLIIKAKDADQLSKVLAEKYGTRIYG